MRVLAAFTLVICLSACGSVSESQVDDIEAGTILSSNPCIDAILVDIAEHDRIVSLSHYSQAASSSSMDVALARQFPVNGGTAEEIIAAKPDIALLGEHTPQATLSAVKRAGIEVVLIGVPTTIEDSLRQIEQIGVAIGNPKKAAMLVSKIKKAVSSAGLASPSKRPALLVWQAGGLVPGEGTLIDDLIQKAGFINASTIYGLAMWDILPLEPVAENPPDIIFTPNTAKSGESRNIGMRRRYIERFDDQIIAKDMPANLLYCGGSTIIEAMELLKNVKSDFAERRPN